MKGKRVVIIAGPNGAGKTTFVEGFLPSIFETPLFVNADKIALGLSPFSPETEAIQAGKLMLRQIDKYAAEGVSFSLETTLSGKGYVKRIQEWKDLGYEVFSSFWRCGTNVQHLIVLQLGLPKEATISRKKLLYAVFKKDSKILECTKS